MIIQAFNPHLPLSLNSLAALLRFDEFFSKRSRWRLQSYRQAGWYFSSANAFDVVLGIAILVAMLLNVYLTVLRKRVSR